MDENMDNGMETDPRRFGSRVLGLVSLQTKPGIAKRTLNSKASLDRLRRNIFGSVHVCLHSLHMLLRAVS